MPRVRLSPLEEHLPSPERSKESLRPPCLHSQNQRGRGIPPHILDWPSLKVLVISAPAMPEFSTQLRLYPVAFIQSRVEKLPASTIYEWQRGFRLPPPWLQMLLLNTLGDPPVPVDSSETVPLNGKATGRRRKKIS